VAGLIPQDKLEQIRAASDIVDVVGSYLPLKRAGANWVALCPFHKEKSPSFNVNPQRQIFHCFGCHKGGDVFTFIKEYESIGFMDAVRRLAERAKIPLEFEKGAPDQQARHIKEQLLQIHEQITQRWQTALAHDAAGQVARDYLARRGVSAEAVKLFRLGCAPDVWDDTVNWARSKGHELPLMEKAGLILRKEGSDHYYDRFRGRLIFPICDEQGRVIAFSGRVLAGDEKTAKYVNSPETPIFTKSKVFFGLDKSKRAVLDAGFAVVCEGQLDLIACFMAGVQNVVAPQGTAFTADHARIIKRYVDEVVLCFDSDEAGQNAAVRSLDSLLASGLAVRVAVVPAPHDPDSFIKESGADAFRKLVERADGFFDYLLNRLCATNEVTTDKGRLAVLRSMAEAVQKTGNVVLIDKYAQKTALRLGVSPDAVREEFRKFAARPAPSPQESDAENAQSMHGKMPEKIEFGLLQLVFQNDDFAEWVSRHLSPAWIRHEVVRNMISDRIAAHRGGVWAGLPSFMNSLPESHQSFLSEALARNYMEGKTVGGLAEGGRDHFRGRSVHNPFEELSGVVLELRNASIDLEIAEIDKRVSELEVGSSLSIQLQQQRAQLRQLKRQPITPLPDRE
jgi:DNA primase